ncbi:MAG: AAA family ATPase, partial [Acidobacteria bacterium]|nr:AAA family ATPase [Acidobacteriota bacterium]
MYPLTIALGIETKELWDEVQLCLRDLPVRVLIEQRDLSDRRTLLDRVERLRPDVVVMEIGALGALVEEATRELKAVSDDMMIAAVHTSAEPEVILAAMRAGVHEYLHPPLQANLRAALERKSAERLRRRDSRTGGRILGFFSAKGGCGATTVACHVGVELGRENTHKVLLADLDIDSGVMGFLLKAKSTYSILDAVENVHRLDFSYWKALVSNGIPGVEIIPAPVASAARQIPSQDELRPVLSFLRLHYDFVIADLGRSLGGAASSVLGELDEAFLVTSLEVPALHQAKAIVQRLLDSGYGKNRLRLVLNRVPKRLDVTPEEIEKMLGLPVYIMLPDDYAELYECYSAGKLLPRTSDLGK